MKKLFIFILSLTLGIAQGIPADITLVSVNVEGNAVTSENTILFTAGLREGQTISQAEFPRAIKRLWQLGLFQDIQLRYDNETDEGLSLTILVKENFILGDLSYDGNKKIKDPKKYFTKSYFTGIKCIDESFFLKNIYFRFYTNKNKFMTLKFIFNFYPSFPCI